MNTDLTYVAFTAVKRKPGNRSPSASSMKHAFSGNKTSPTVSACSVAWTEIILSPAYCIFHSPLELSIAGKINKGNQLSFKVILSALADLLIENTTFILSYFSKWQIDLQAFCLFKIETCKSAKCRIYSSFKKLWFCNQNLSVVCN